MESTTTSRVHAIFDETVDLAPAQRAEILDRLCAGDRTLRAAVEELLAANDQAGQFLAETVIAPGQFRAFPGLGPGSQVGPYVLRRVLGEGGYGVVFLAEQEQPLKRKVALKVIKAGMDTRQVIRRFELERQALALMDHPNIARVLDAGSTEDGRPYFVMELVEGREIGRYCRENQLPLRQRLELFLQVCNAVQHAHQKGVIHRDLKPSNVMVAVHDGRGVPKVIDFGIAKALAESQINPGTMTQLWQCIGTPQYMSPEQVQAPVPGAAGALQVDIDTRCDVYSLGVVLYELLTDVPAFEPASLMSVAMAEMQRIIREVDPPAPSSRLTQSKPASEGGTGGPPMSGDHGRAARATERRKIADQIRGDLDWIVMKAMEKDRTRRYGTAEAMAADIGRYLADEPVSAGPPSRVYRLRKFVRRNRPLIAAALSVALVLALGFAGTAAGLVSARVERNRAVKAQAAEETQRAAAERAADQARVSEVRARQSEAQAKANEARAIANEEKVKAEAARLLAAQQFLFQIVGSPLGTYTGKGAPRAVLDYVSYQAGSVWLREHPEVEGPIRAGLGKAYKARGDLPIAQAEYHRAVELFRVCEPGGLELASALHNEANTILIRGGNQESIPLFRESLALYRKQQGSDNFLDAPVLDGLGVALANSGQLEPAIPLLRQAVSIFRQSEVPHSPHVLGSLGHLRDVLRADHQETEAQAAAREIEQIQSDAATQPAQTRPGQ